MHESKNIGFIGGGMVAEAIIRGLILHGHDASKIHVSDPSEDRRNILSILNKKLNVHKNCLLYTSPSPRDRTRSRMPSSA